jgi:hypothetical protein
MLENGRSLPEARTPDAAPISALPLVGRKARDIIKIQPGRA